MQPKGLSRVFSNTTVQKQTPPKTKYFSEQPQRRGKNTTKPQQLRRKNADFVRNKSPLICEGEFPCSGICHFMLCKSQVQEIEDLTRHVYFDQLFGLSLTMTFSALYQGSWARGVFYSSCTCALCFPKSLGESGCGHGTPLFLHCEESSGPQTCVPSVLVTRSCPTLCDPTDCRPPGSSVHGILQARTLESVARPFSRGSSRPRDSTRTCVSHVFCIGRQVLYRLSHEGSPNSCVSPKNDVLALWPRS